MRRNKITKKATDTIKATASKAADAVKTAPIADSANAIKEKAEKVVEKVADKAPEYIDAVSEKAEEFMNSPVIEEGKDILKENTEKAVKAARSKITKVSSVTLEIFETNVTMEAIEKAVKKDVSAKKLKGDIKIYVNAERRAAYYTVNDEGSEVYKIDLRTL